MKTEWTKTGFARIVAAGGYSLRGLRDAWRNEAAFRQEVAAAAVLLPLALVVPVSVVEKLMLACSVLLVLIVELLNSAIEAVVDRVSPERHELSRQAKDIGSAAVLLSLLLAGIVWVVIVGRLMA